MAWTDFSSKNRANLVDIRDFFLSLSSSLGHILFKSILYSIDFVFIFSCGFSPLGHTQGFLIVHSKTIHSLYPPAHPDCSCWKTLKSSGVVWLEAVTSSLDASGASSVKWTISWYLPLELLWVLDDLIYLKHSKQARHTVGLYPC